MWPYHPDLLARPVPRYTSYPTAAEFVPDGWPGEWAAAFDQGVSAAEGPVSLYLHIPFCQAICWYCGCNTGAANKQARLATYLEALHRDIARVAARLPQSMPVQRIALGGGSPNAISPLEFVRLLDAVMTHFAVADPAISLELDPRSFSPEWAPVIRSTGITHASLGVQTFDAGIQARIGRIQPHASIAMTTACLRGAGVQSINYDLMYGLPGQTLDMLDATIDATLALAPDRIALFGYAHVPHLLPRQRRIDASALPDQALRFAMAAHGYARLCAAGYVPVGFDHFALPHDAMATAAAQGTLSRNFQGFTDDGAATLIGLGASAISMLPDAIIQNEKNSGRYRMRLSQDGPAAALGVYRSAQDRATGQVITDILCSRPAVLTAIGGGARWAPALSPFITRGLITLDGDRLFPNQATTPYARSIAATFDRYRADQPARFSNAV